MDQKRETSLLWRLVFIIIALGKLMVNIGENFGIGFNSWDWVGCGFEDLELWVVVGLWWWCGRSGNWLCTNQFLLLPWKVRVRFSHPAGLYHRNTLACYLSLSLFFFKSLLFLLVSGLSRPHLLNAGFIGVNQYIWLLTWISFFLKKVNMKDCMLFSERLPKSKSHSVTCSVWWPPWKHLNL